MSLPKINTLPSRTHSAILRLIEIFTAVQLEAESIAAHAVYSHNKTIFTHISVSYVFIGSVCESGIQSGSIVILTVRL